MKGRVVWAVVAMLSVALWVREAGANPFVNLDFEQATVPAGTVSAISTSDAVPGWTARYSTIAQPISVMNYDPVGLDGEYLALFDQPQGDVPVLQGRFYIDMESSTDPVASARTVVSLGQVGDVPAGSRSLRFLGEDYLVPDPNLPLRVPVVIVNGNALAPVRVSATGTPHVSVFGVDVSPFSGLTVDLRFASPRDPVQSVMLDAISFSPSPIPEPVSMGSIAVMFIVSSRIRGRLRVV